MYSRKHSLGILKENEKNPGCVFRVVARRHSYSARFGPPITGGTVAMGLSKELILDYAMQVTGGGV